MLMSSSIPARRLHARSWLPLIALLVTAVGARSAAAAAAGSLCNTPAATGCAGTTSLTTDTNKIHYDIHPGQTVTSKIIGATELTGTETCTAGGSGVDVIIKSSDFGNQTVCGSF